MTGVIVVGSINVDLVARVPRLPAPGETVIGGTFTRSGGGKGANQAAAVARLGGTVWLVGAIGDDELGREAREDLERLGVDVSQLRTGTRHTGVALIMVDRRGENLIAVASGANTELTADMVRDALQAIRAEGAVVLASLEVADEAVMAAATGARERGWRFALNPAPARSLSPELLSRCDVLTPNEHEAMALGRPSVEELLATGAGAIVVTRGAAGADLLRPGRVPLHQDAFPVRAVDTTGAGDAFTATLAWAMSEGADVDDAVRMAAAAGALATRAVGARTSLPDRATLDSFLAEGPELQ